MLLPRIAEDDAANICGLFHWIPHNSTQYTVIAKVQGCCWRRWRWWRMQDKTYGWGVIYIPPPLVTPPALAADWCPSHSRYFLGNRGQQRLLRLATHTTTRGNFWLGIHRRGYSTSHHSTFSRYRPTPPPSSTIQSGNILLVVPSATSSCCRMR